MKDYTLKNGVILHGSSYNYTIEQVLGNGTFGITYLARVQMKGTLGSLDAGINVAVKEFFMRDFNGRDECSVTNSSKDGAFAYYKSKFIHEAENLSKLRHPGIIKVIELFEENQTAYYVMEYLPNGSLDRYIATRKTLSPQECINYAVQICEALDHMHSNRMLHLDLKPNNIMIDEKGKLVLIDFGLSKQFDQSGNPETSTTIGHGTPGYAPIEQANYQDNKHDSFPATMDIYALGATMFKMLTGHRPPEASVILNDGFPSDDLKSEKTPNELIKVVHKCMEPVRNNRYKSIKEIINILSTATRLVVEDTTVLADIIVKKTQSREKEQEYEIFEIPADTFDIRINFDPGISPNGRFNTKYDYRLISTTKCERTYAPEILRNSITTDLTSIIRDFNNLRLEVGKYINDKQDYFSDLVKTGELPPPSELCITFESQTKGLMKLYLRAEDTQTLEGNIYNVDIYSLAQAIYQIIQKYIPQQKPDFSRKPRLSPTPKSESQTKLDSNRYKDSFIGALKYQIIELLPDYKFPMILIFINVFFMELYSCNFLYTWLGISNSSIDIIYGIIQSALVIWLIIKWIKRTPSNIINLIVIALIGMLITTFIMNFIDFSYHFNIWYALLVSVIISLSIYIVIPIYGAILSTYNKYRI